MKFIDLGELSIMFDTKFEVPQDSEYTLCNWIDSSEENEMKIISFTFNKADLPNRTNFSIFDEEEYKTFVKNIQQRLNMAGNATGDKISFIDDGYFKVNDNIIIWTSGIVNYSNSTSANVFYYCVWRSKTLYIISYFTTDESNKPNDVILTSLNSLKIK